MILKVGLMGASGRMGLEIANLLNDGFTHQGTSLEFCDGIGNTSKLLSIDSVPLRTLDTPQREPVHLWIDFSRPEGTLGLLEKIAHPVLIGTTGFDRKSLTRIREYSERFPVCLAPNTSLGMGYLRKALRAMPRPESGFSCVIEETHHKEKKDAPSGTAKALKEIVESLGFTDVPIHSTRGGTVVGIHRVRFLGDGEEICLEHNAGDRRLFARGALIAAISLYKKEKAGLYTLEDLLENN